MGIKRTDRLNSLLREVISEVIRRDVENPLISELFAVSRVEITKDLRNAKVFVSIIGTDKEKRETIDSLNQSAGFIAVRASKQVVMRFFPSLRFILDETVENQMRIEELLNTINEEKRTRDDKRSISEES